MDPISEEIAVSPISANVSLGSAGKGRANLFSDEQRTILLRYFDEYGMTSTHRRNTELMERCANEVGTTLERVKNWIGSEAVKRKKRAGVLPRPKVEITGNIPTLKVKKIVPGKRFKRVNGYNLFFSHYVRKNSEMSPDLKERNCVVAQKWSELSDDDRKAWSLKAEAVCEASLQRDTDTPTGDSIPDSAIIEKALITIQEKFDLLQQMGFEGYGILVNTRELQTHLAATAKGKMYHRLRQKTGKPLENPFIGYVFSEQPELDVMASSESLTSPLDMSPAEEPSPKRNKYSFPINSMETMQRSVMNAFALKYKVATGSSDILYNNLENLGVQIYGMPAGLQFHSPLLYTQQQLQQILANLEKIVFLKIGTHDQTEQMITTEVDLSTSSDVDLSTQSVAATLVTATDDDIPAVALEETETIETS